MFITQFSTVGVRKPVFTKILPTALPEKEPLVTLYLNYLQFLWNIQPSIYSRTNQPHANLWYWLQKILRISNKDYLISTLPEDQHEAIKNKFLNNCIRDNISNINIKTVASRAVWLGNDETHYTRKWEDKDINDLKSIIELTLHWIESEIRTQNF